MESNWLQDFSKLVPQRVQIPRHHTYTYTHGHTQENSQWNPQPPNPGTVVEMAHRSTGYSSSLSGHLRHCFCDVPRWLVGQDAPHTENRAQASIKERSRPAVRKHVRQMNRLPVKRSWWPQRMIRRRHRSSRDRTGLGGRIVSRGPLHISCASVVASLQLGTIPT